MARIAVVLFLARYKAHSGLGEKAFFSCFSLAIYDFLETRKEQEREEELEQRYGKDFLERLVQASQETTQVHRNENSHLTRLLLKESLGGNYQDFCRELRPFLQVFIWDYQKQYLNTQKH